LVHLVVNHPEWSLEEFVRAYPDDAACLDYLWRERFAPDGHTADCPKCNQPRRFHRVQSRASYSCDACGRHVHPTKGTIFEGSSTSLRLWFYAIYLMTSTGTEISAKQLERELGVTYKTAWRMSNMIRDELMVDDGEPLSAGVGVDDIPPVERPRAQLPWAGAMRLVARGGAIVFGAVSLGWQIERKLCARLLGRPASGPR
jgi:transposase-like protein